MGKAAAGIRMIRKTTPARLLNASKVLYSYHRSRRTGNPAISGFPVSLSVEPTTSCNLRCPQCPSGLRQFTRPRGMIDHELFESILSQTGKYLSYLTFYFQGEPFLHKGFSRMVTQASKRGIYTATSTNAHFLDEDTCAEIVRSGLDKLIISLDGTTQETYSRYRIGGDISKVLNGVRELVRIRKKLKSATPFINIQFIVFSHNMHEMAEVRRLSQDLGADEISFKTAQVYDEAGLALLPDDPLLSRYVLHENKPVINGILPDHCWRMWHSCVITWDGLVVPCCFDKDAEFRLGDLKSQTFAEIWNGAVYREFRKKLISGRKSIPMCSNCSEGAKVWLRTGLE